MPPAPILPKNWPGTVTYLTAPAYSKEVTKTRYILTVSDDISTNDHSLLRLPLQPCKMVRITPIENPSHPAHGQCGLFASQHLPAACFILPYFGFVHTAAESNRTSDYDLSLDRATGIGIDATEMGNEARFINDYRGTANDGPNAEFKEILVQVKLNNGTSALEKAIGVFVLPAGKAGKKAKGIQRGQEIVVSYGKGFWSERRAEDPVR